MIALSPPLLLATANAFAGMHDDRPPATPGSRGVLGDFFLREVGLSKGGAGTFPLAPDGCGEAQPEARDVPRPVFWDAAFVHHIGFWSHYDPREERSWWPLPLVKDLSQLAAFARERSVLRHTPVAGDVFLLRSPNSDGYVRAGIVTGVKEAVEREDGTDAFECNTIEGDTGPNLELGGGGTLRHWRRLCPARGDRFVRWTALDRRVERPEEIEQVVELRPARRFA